MKSISIVILFCFVSILHTQNNGDAKEQIRRVMDQQVAGWNSGNIDSFMFGYAQFDSLRFASGGSVTYGWKNMLQRYKKVIQQKKQWGFSHSVKYRSIIFHPMRR